MSIRDTFGTSRALVTSSFAAAIGSIMDAPSFFQFS